MGLWPFPVAVSQSASDRVAAAEADLRDRGFDLVDAAWGTVAEGPSTGLVGAEAPLHLIHPRDGRPLTVVSEVANAAHEGRVPLLVADEGTLEAARELLAAPFLLAARTPVGRWFHAVEDRIALPDGTFAAVAGRGPLRWREAPADDRTGAEGPRLVADVGEETVLELRSVDTLTCPGPTADAVPYRYGRGSDGRYRVWDRVEEVARFDSVAAMRRAGYRPLDLPLVPEHHVREGEALARAVRLVTVAADGTVGYEAPTTS